MEIKKGHVVAPLGFVINLLYWCYETFEVGSLPLVIEHFFEAFLEHLVILFLIPVFMVLGRLFNTVEAYTIELAASNVRLRHEITERKKAEEALRESRDFVHTVIDGIADPTLVVDPKTYRIVMANLAAQRLTDGKDPASLGLTCHQVSHHRENPCFGAEDVCPLKEVLATKAPVRVTHTHLDADNNESIVDIIATPVFDRKGKIVQVIESCRDVTDIKRAERELEKHREHLEELVAERTTKLRESEERYRELFENATDIVYTHDLAGNFTSINGAAERVSGYTHEEILGMNIAQVVAPEYQELVRHMLECKFDEGIRTRYELEILSKDGRRVPLEVSHRIIYREGEPVEVQGIARDITERKRAEEKMKRRLMKFKLEEGSQYLVEEHRPALSLEVFKDLLKVGYRGVVISRNPEKEFKRIVEGNFGFLWLAERGGEEGLPPKLEEIESLIKDLPEKSAVLIDRLDYLVSKNGFKKTLSFVEHLRELAYISRLVVILSIDPSILDKQELRLLKKETRVVEAMEKDRLPGGLLDVLKFVYRQNTTGIKPSLTDIGGELGLSKPTVRKRIRLLVSYGYLMEVVKGRCKVIELTDRGWDLFLK
jgi:PAS domain S-box-containing protein